MWFYCLRKEDLSLTAAILQSFQSPSIRSAASFLALKINAYKQQFGTQINVLLKFRYRRCNIATCLNRHASQDWKMKCMRSNIFIDLTRHWIPNMNKTTLEKGDKIIVNKGPIKTKNAF